MTHYVSKDGREISEADIVMGAINSSRIPVVVFPVRGGYAWLFTNIGGSLESPTFPTPEIAYADFVATFHEEILDFIYTH